MVTEKQLITALKAADAAGETADARVLAKALKDMRSKQSVSQTESAVRGAAQGGTLGFSDELAGVTGASMETLFPTSEREPFGDLYELYRDSQREQNAQAREDNPGTYMAGEFAGGMVVPGGGAVKGAQTLNRVTPSVRPLGAATVSGGVTGGVAGAGYSEGETAGEVGADTAVGAGTGAVLGPAVGYAGQKVAEAGSGVGGFVRRKFYSSPQESARLRTGRALQADGYTDIAAIRDQLSKLGPEGRLADIGPVLQTEATRAAQSPGPGQRLAVDFLNKRQRGQESRLEAAAREHVDPMWTDYRGFLQQVKTDRSKQAKEAYEAAWLVPIEITDTMASLQNNGIFKRAFEKATKATADDVRVASGASDLSADGMLSSRLLDQTLRELGDMAAPFWRSGQNAKAGRIKAVKDMLQGEIMEQNPYLARARSIHRGGKEIEEAAMWGRDIMSKKVRVDDIADVMEDWSESEVDAMRVGMLQGIFDKIEDAATNQNSASRLVNSSRVEKVLQKLFKDEDSYESFMQNVNAENVMQETRNKATGGSPTYKLMAGDQTLPMSQPQGVIGWTQQIFRWLGASDDDIAQLRAQDFEEVAKLMFNNVDDATLEKLIAPTLGMRVRSGGAIGGTPIRLGTGTNAVTQGQVQGE